MDSEPREIGRRVRYWRERRKLPRQQFAAMVGRSTSWLIKIESGERELVRLPMIERVAEVLGIDPAVLTNDAQAERARQCVDTVEVQAIRSALAAYPALAVQDTKRVSLDNIQRQAAYLDHAWLTSRFTVVARHLPKLMRDAQRAVLDVASADSVAAHRVLVTAYRLASSMLLKFEANDIAWMAADRAMFTASALRTPGHSRGQRAVSPAL